MDKFIGRPVSVRGLELSLCFEVTPKEAAYRIVVDIEPLSETREGAVIIPSISRQDGDMFYLKSFHLKIQIPLLDIHGVSMPGKANNPFLFGIPWRLDEYTSSHRSFPFLCFINREGKNKLALGVKDPKPGYHLTGKLNKDEQTFELSIESLATVREAPQVFLLQEELPWFTVTQIYSDWTGTGKQDVPSDAYEPVFCTWYAVHQDLTQDWVERVAAEAYGLGFRTLILDDGWFTLSTEKGYWYTGDWEVCTEKFPNFKQHVQQVQSLGMRYVLWIAPFMVGKKSRAYKEFEHLRVTPRDSFASLCPQSSITHEHLLETITELYNRYNLDGFKFDFIDSLPTKPCQANGHSHFCDSPGEGVERILESLTKRLKSLGNEHPLIEFRQEYASPAMRQYCTGFRAIDAPLDFDNNRRRIINLRSFSNRFPVYSDPMFWHAGESLENIARHFISCIFSVPILSVDLLRLGDDEKEVIKFWIDFYRRHRDALLFGKFTPVFSAGDFLAAFAIQGGKGILALYNCSALLLGEEFLGGQLHELLILNGSNCEVIEIACKQFIGDWQVEVTDKKGKPVGTFTKRLNGRVATAVEIGGVVRVTKAS